MEYQTGLALNWDKVMCCPVKNPLPLPRNPTISLYQGFLDGQAHVKEYLAGQTTGLTGQLIPQSVYERNPWTYGYENGRKTWIRRQLLPLLKGQKLNLFTKEVFFNTDDKEAPVIEVKPLRRKQLVRTCVAFVLWSNWTTLPATLAEMCACYEQAMESESSQAWVLTKEQKPLDQLCG